MKAVIDAEFADMHLRVEVEYEDDRTAADAMDIANDALRTAHRQMLSEQGNPEEPTSAPFDMEATQPDGPMF